jgi:hypothetical protein
MEAPGDLTQPAVVDAVRLIRTHRKDPAWFPTLQWYWDHHPADDSLSRLPGFIKFEGGPSVSVGTAMRIARAMDTLCRVSIDPEHVAYFDASALSDDAVLIVCATEYDASGSGDINRIAALGRAEASAPEINLPGRVFLAAMGGYVVATADRARRTPTTASGVIDGAIPVGE